MKEKAVLLGLVVLSVALLQPVISVPSTAIENQITSTLSQKPYNPTTLLRTWGTNSSGSDDWSDALVIGDAYRIEFFYGLLDSIKREFGLEALNNTAQAWIDYREWMKYPHEWSNIRRLIGEAHARELPISTTFGYHVAEPTKAPASAESGFLYLYRRLPEEEKWRYPDGTVSEDPYSVGASRSFSGAYVWRVLNRDSYAIMQPQNPYWENFFIDWAKKNIDQGADGIWFDSVDGIFTPFWHGGFGCKNTWEGLGFIDYLTNKLSEENLRSLGVTDLENFCFKDYLVQKFGLKSIHGSYRLMRGLYKYSWPPEMVEFETPPSVIMEDEIVKEYILYQYHSLLDVVRSSINEVKSYAQSKGKDVVLTMNDYETWVPETDSIHGVTGILLAPHFDANYVERNTEAVPPYQTDVAVVKAALAAVQHAKPVWISEWILWFSNPYYPDKPPEDISNLIKVKIAEDFSSGGIRLVPFGTGSPEEGWPPERLISGSERPEVAQYYRFISSENRLLFRNVESNARVVLLYSLPTVVWNYFPAMGLFPRYKAEAGGWARALEVLHIPYDIQILGHPELYEDNLTLESLKKYDVAITVGTTSISEAHLETLRKYVNAGGKLITTGTFGIKDEYNRRRAESVIDNFEEGDNIVVVDDGLGYEFQASLEDKDLDISRLEPIKRVLFEAVPASAIIRLENLGTAEAIYISPMIQTTTNKLLVHLVNYNYDYDREKDWIEPTGPFSVTVYLPPALENVSSVYITSPDTGEKIEPEFQIQENLFTVEVPNLEVWSTIVVEPVPLLTREVDVLISPSEKESAPGDTVTFTVKVTNMGEAVDNYNLTVSDNAGWGAALSENRLLSVENGSSRTVTVDVVIPEGASEGDSTTITVTASDCATDSSTARVGVEEEEGPPWAYVGIAVVIIVIIVAAIAVTRGR